MNTLDKLFLFIGGHGSLLLRWFLINSQTFSSFFRTEHSAGHLRSNILLSKEVLG